MVRSRLGTAFYTVEEKPPNRQIILLKNAHRIDLFDVVDMIDNRPQHFALRSASSHLFTPIKRFHCHSRAHMNKTRLDHRPPSSAPTWRRHVLGREISATLKIEKHCLDVIRSSIVHRTGQSVGPTRS
jgi:hypothetical protein